MSPTEQKNVFVFKKWSKKLANSSEKQEKRKGILFLILFSILSRYHVWLSPILILRIQQKLSLNFYYTLAVQNILISMKYFTSPWSVLFKVTKCISQHQVWLVLICLYMNISQQHGKPYWRSCFRFSGNTEFNKYIPMTSSWEKELTLR